MVLEMALEILELKNGEFGHLRNSGRRDRGKWRDAV